LAKSARWLLEDLSSSKTGRFYVMQANPNNAETFQDESVNF
jgi:hypothetical protein